MVRLLLESASVPIDPRDATGCTPLMLAVERGAERVALYLTGKGADVEVSTWQFF